MKRIIIRSLSLIAAAMLALGICGCSGKSDKYIVMKVGDNNVGYDEYRYFYMNFRREHRERGDSDYSASVKSEVESALKQKYAISDYAAERSVSLTKEEEKEVKAEIDSYIAAYGSKEAFEASKAEACLSDDQFLDLLRSEKLEAKLRNFEYDEFTGSILSDDATVEKYISEHFIHATQILILNKAGEDIAPRKALAEDISKRIADGGDFDSLLLEYNEDSHMNGETVGYYFAPGQLLPEFEKAAAALDIGEISSVIPSTVGWHIIKRLPLEDEYIDKHFEELRSIYKTCIFNENVRERAAKEEIAYTSYYDTLTEEMLVEGIREVK